MFATAAKFDDRLNTSPQTHLRRPEVLLLQLLDPVQNFPLPVKETRRDMLDLRDEKTPIITSNVSIQTAPATTIFCPFPVINQ
jgi:hypothetical protein